MKDKQKFPWPKGRQCAVSLTYDDSLPVHHEQVAPLLAKNGLKATFNLSANVEFTRDAEKWRNVAALGHELGNHSLFHPCRALPDRNYKWLAPDYDYCEYSIERWLDEMRVGNCLLRLLDQRTERTYGNTCGDTTIGKGDTEVSLDDLILKLFVAGRGSCNSRIVDPANPNFGRLGHFNGDIQTCDQLRENIEIAAEQGGWIIFMFHGVGKGTHGGYIETDQHAALVDYLAQNSNRIWTSSMVEVAKFLKEQLPQ